MNQSLIFITNNCSWKTNSNLLGELKFSKVVLKAHYFDYSTSHHIITAKYSHMLVWNFIVEIIVACQLLLVDVFNYQQ